MSGALLRLWRLGRSLVRRTGPAAGRPAHRPPAPATSSAPASIAGKPSTSSHWRPTGSASRSAGRWSSAAYRWREQPGSDPGWAPPKVEDGRGRRHAAGSRAAIKLPRWARTRAVVLHECAHGMADDQHGPGFVAAYVVLLERFAGLDRGAAAGHAVPRPGCASSHRTSRGVRHR